MHDSDYLNYLGTAWQEWARMRNVSFEVRPYIPTNRHFPTLRTFNPVTLAGHYLGDGGSPLVDGAWENMNASADTAVAAANALIANVGDAYALVRPTGQHAMRDMALGGCHIAIMAIAIQRLAKRLGRVAVLGIDVHHGNGTQQIFYDQDDVLTVSVHGDPQTLFAFISGFPDERGKGLGEGYNITLPLEPHTELCGYLPVLDRAIQHIVDFSPAALVVAAGYDTCRHDSFGNLCLDAPDYTLLGTRIGQFGLPTLFVHEEGIRSIPCGPLQGPCWWAFCPSEAEQRDQYPNNLRRFGVAVEDRH